jgi:hypothetical protein
VHALPHPSKGNSIPPGAFLIVGPTQWYYTGSVVEDYSYTRQGDTLQIARLGDHRLVASQYSSPEGVGKALGPPDHFLVTRLTAWHLILRDSTCTPSGSSVNYLYHSRVGQD